MNDTTSKHIVILCDQTVDFHFPAHFYKVYCELLPQRGYKTTVIANYRDPNHPNVKTMRDMGVILLEKKAGHASILKRLIYTFTQVLALGKILFFGAGKQADAYIVHNDPIIALMVFIKTLLGQKRPFLYRLTHLIPEEILLSDNPKKRLLAKINRALRNVLLKRSNGILPTSPVAAQIIIDQLPEVKDKTRALFATADFSPDLFNPKFLDYAQGVKARMDKAPCEKWMVYLGTLSRNRQLTLMIDALHEIRETTDIPAGLVIYGIESQAGGVDELKAYAKSKNILDYVLFEPPVTEELLPYVISLADVGISCFPVNSVVKSNSPLKTLDYARSGIPVVGSPIDNHLETIEESGAGYIAENIPEAFAQAVIKLLEESAESRQTRMEKAQVWMKKNRALSVAVDILDETFKSVL